MISQRLADWLQARNIHYGWVVAATTFLTMLATAGAMGSAGVLIGPLEAEFGWSTADISSAMAVRLVLFGLFGPFAAAFMNQFGVRNVVATALILIAIGIVGSFFMAEVWQLVLLWGLIVGVGTGMTAMVLGATVAARWFDKQRGLVVGLMTASSATGQLVFLPLLATLAEDFGWRAAMGFVVTIIALAMILVLLLMRDQPSDLGIAPYGATEIRPRPPRSASLGALLLSPLLALKEASRSHAFWVLFLTFFICGFSTNGLIQTHWISICGDVGIAAVGAAGILALIGIFDMIGTIGSGWLSDRYDSRWLLFWFYGLRGLSLLYLPYSGFSAPAIAAFAVFYGLDWVATVPPTVKLAADNFGPDKAGLIFAWVFTGHQLGAAAAAFSAGATRTELGTYGPAILVAGALCLLAAGLAISIGRKDRTAPTMPASAAA
ncbi:MFS transporter [Devosia epidermidihirudinis]|uniref:MFS transporter n=1 Tax=Devosia epidermidihirudinis TaxID=1293439 RepID=A0A0F5QBP8_9HYPH|nr:MFS transporter [Devosia epidermidihirudinis]KKC38116.1 MFS transporter [Devosia epidermidihirudinis]